MGGVEIFSDGSTLRAARQRAAELEQLALLDPLTGLANRRYLELRLQARLDEWARHGWAFAVVMLDLDHFKQVNDVHGHTTGDAVLQMVATTLGACARGSDLVGRWGGEAFLMLLGHVGPAGLLPAAERIRALVRAAQLVREHATIGMTVSIGAALVPQRYG